MLKILRQLWKKLKKTHSRPPMFKGKKTLSDCHPAKHDLQIKYKTHPNPNKILHRTRKINSKIPIEVQNPWVSGTMLNGQSNPSNITYSKSALLHTPVEQELKWCCSTIKERQIHEKARIPQKFYKAGCSHLIFDKDIKYIFLGNGTLQQMVLGQNKYLPYNPFLYGNEAQSLSLTLHKHKFKSNHRL